jgi:hypothetical protein
MRVLKSVQAMTSKRHAKPTAQQLVERSYRHVIGLKRVLMKDATENRQLIRNDLKGIYDYIAEMDRHIGIQERTLRSHVLALADHCARLLREKETLMRRLALTGAKPAKWEDFMKGTCPFADNHRLNHACGVCGHLEISEDNYNPNWHKPEPTNTHNHPVTDPCSPSCSHFPVLK